MPRTERGTREERETVIDRQRQSRRATGESLKSHRKYYEQRRGTAINRVEDQSDALAGLSLSKEPKYLSTRTHRHT